MIFLKTFLGLLLKAKIYMTPFYDTFVSASLLALGLLNLLNPTCIKTLQLAANKNY